MKHIYTYGGQEAQRHLTVGCLLKNKAAGKRMTQVTAFDAEEAAAAAEQEIDTLTIETGTIESIRNAAPHIFITAAQSMRQFATEDEALGGAIETMAKGADAIYSPRGLATIERIAREGISVQGHTGLFPARATQFGGLRTVGKTATEALSLLQDFRRLEEAGAYCAEVECVAEEALAEIKKHSKLLMVTIGAGSSGDIILSYMSDLCGDTENAPRHAKAFGNVGAIRKALAAERARSLAGYRSAVMDGSFPDSTTSVSMPAKELGKLKEGLDKLRPGTSRSMTLINVRVAKVTEEAVGIRSFLLSRASPFRLPKYEPGAHIDVHCGEGIIRQYSLCGDPGDRRHFMIAVRQVAPSRGGSDLMHLSVKHGDRLGIGSPRNNFPLDESASHSILLAGGVGITPIIAMADRLNGLSQSFEVHYFSRSEKHTAFRDRLRNGPYGPLVTLHEGLDIQQTEARLSRILAIPTEGGRVYMCGPGPFMNTAEAEALKFWPRDAVRLERFAANPALGGAPTRAFQIELARTGLTLDVGAHETILDVLDANDITAPFSCEQGVCGTCVTEVLDGDPDHRDSFLSARQKEAGNRMCLCVSRAKGEKIRLSL